MLGYWALKRSSPWLKPHNSNVIECSRPRGVCRGGLISVTLSGKVKKGSRSYPNSTSLRLSRRRSSIAL